jgi:hypothetical protein
LGAGGCRRIGLGTHREARDWAPIRPFEANKRQIVAGFGRVLIALFDDNPFHLEDVLVADKVEIVHTQHNLQHPVAGPPSCVDEGGLRTGAHSIQAMGGGHDPTVIDSGTAAEIERLFGGARVHAQNRQAWPIFEVSGLAAHDLCACCRAGAAILGAARVDREKESRRQHKPAQYVARHGDWHVAPLATKSLTHCGEVANEAQRLVCAGWRAGAGASNSIY